MHNKLLTNVPNKILAPFILVFLAMQISACSKTVKWEEEVPLNTGEIIIVKRVDHFSSGTSPGNPFKHSWWLNTRSYDFSWQGNYYSYKVDGGAFGPIILYAYPDKKIISIVDSGSPKCIGYAEYHPSKNGWKIQNNINTEILSQPRNLMGFYSAYDGDIPEKVTQKFIEDSRFDLPQMGGSIMHIPKDRIAKNCLKINNHAKQQ